MSNLTPKQARIVVFIRLALFLAASSAIVYGVGEIFGRPGGFIAFGLLTILAMVGPDR
jgi:hypothetical protein